MRVGYAIAQLAAWTGLATAGSPAPLRWTNELSGRVGQNVLQDPRLIRSLRGFVIEDGDMVLGYRYGSRAESRAHQSNGGVLKSKGWLAWAQGVVQEYVFDQWAANSLAGDGVYFSAHWAMKNPNKAAEKGFYTDVCIAVTKMSHVESVRWLAIHQFVHKPEDVAEYVRKEAERAVGKEEAQDMINTAIRFSYGWPFPWVEDGWEQTSLSIELQVQNRMVDEGKIRIQCVPREWLRAIDHGPAPWFTEAYKLRMVGHLSKRKGSNNKRTAPVSGNNPAHWEPTEVPETWYSGTSW